MHACTLLQTPQARRGLHHTLAALGALTLTLLAGSLPAQVLDTGTQVATTLTRPDSKVSPSAGQVRDGLPNEPGTLFQGVDMMNLFIVTESDGGHITLLDGDRFEPLYRFAPGHRLHDEPRFSPDGRHLFFTSDDGWITKFDLWTLRTVSEARVGMQTRNLALSRDGKYLAVANADPHTLVLLDADLKPIREHQTLNKHRTQSSPVLGVQDAGPRQSFVAVLADVPEVWEVSYNPTTDDVPIGVIHDFLYKEGAFIPGFLNPRRSYLAEPISGFSLTPSSDELVATGRETGQGQIIHLDVRKKIANLQLPGRSRLDTGTSWQHRPPSGGPERTVFAAASLDSNLIGVIDLQTWDALKNLSAPGPDSCLHSHENAPHVWAHSMTVGQAGDTLQLFDKHRLEAVYSSRPAPGKTLGHVEFTRDGRYAVTSVSGRKGDGGALVVLDAITFKEVKRVPMDGPVGLYNLHNRIARPLRARG